MIPDDLYENLEKLYPKCFIDIQLGSLFGNRRHKHVVIDVDCCLNRLYGSKFVDWSCGGQWNEMVVHLSLIRAVANQKNIEFVFFFDGTADISRYYDWNAVNTRINDNVSRIWNHIQRKGTPPPRAWFIHPPTLQQSLKGALRLYGFETYTSSVNHRNEMLEHLLTHPHSAFVTSDKFYIFNPKLPNSIKLLSASQFRLDCESTSIRCSRIDLAELSNQLQLSSAQKYAFLALSGNHILPRHEIMTIVEPEYLQKHQNWTASQMYIRGLLNFVKKHEDTSICNSIIAKIAEFWVHSDHKSKAEKFRSAFDFFSCANLQLKKEGALKAASVQVKERAAEKIRQVSDIFQSKPEWSAKLPPANQNILKIAQELHTSGQLHPWIFPLLSNGEVFFTGALEDIVQRKYLVRSLEVTKPLRQILYGILFSISSSIQKEYRKKRSSNPILLREWHPNNRVPKLVRALPIQTWKTPDLKVLWLSRRPADFNRRVRTLISTFLSDTPFFAELQPNLVIPLIVLRYLNQQPGSLLRVMDINVFLSVILSPNLRNVAFTSKLDPNLTQRGVALSSMFIRCCEHASFANDICGQPLPPEYTYPWNYFDGKLFQYKLALASRSDTSSLLNLCFEDHRVIPLLESLRAAILEGTPSTLISIPK